MTGKEAKSTKAAKQSEEDRRRTKGASERGSFLSELGDIGNFEMPDLDGLSLNLADFLPSDEMEETRYTLPKLVHYDEEEFVLYENAEKLAHDLKPIPRIHGATHSSPALSSTETSSRLSCERTERTRRR